MGTEERAEGSSVEATGSRKITHIDMDAFYASVEQRDNPELRVQAGAVGGARERGVVAAGSYEARKFGVHSATQQVSLRDPEATSPCGDRMWDHQSGMVGDPAKVSDVEHRGRFFKVSGPLNTSPSPQDRPVLLRAPTCRSNCKSRSAGPWTGQWLRSAAIPRRWGLSGSSPASLLVKIRGASRAALTGYRWFA
jgi:hypothetical protein